MESGLFAGQSLHFETYAAKLVAMKIVRFKAGGAPRYGILEGASIQVIEGNPYGRIKTGPEKYRLDKVKLLAPCQPSKVLEVGNSYHLHA